LVKPDADDAARTATGNHPHTSALQFPDSKTLWASNCSRLLQHEPSGREELGRLYATSSHSDTCVAVHSISSAGYHSILLYSSYSSSNTICVQYVLPFFWRHAHLLYYPHHCDTRTHARRTAFTHRTRAHTHTHSIASEVASTVPHTPPCAHLHTRRIFLHHTCPTYLPHRTYCPRILPCPTSPAPAHAAPRPTWFAPHTGRQTLGGMRGCVACVT